MKNTVMLYLMTFARIVLPLLTLPYLTRVFSTDSYGVVTYSKSVMSYFQMVVDFGFMLSATKDIVKFRDNKEKVSAICSEVMFAKIILSCCSFVFLIFMIFTMPILKQNYLFVFLSFISCILSIFLPDYLFRGFEIMHVITYRFIISKLISTVLTLVLIRSDSQLLLIPIFDILSTIVAIFLTNLQIKKLEININLSLTTFRKSIHSIIISLNYFLSNLAGTLLGAFNTVVLGIYLSTSDVAYWGVVNSLIVAVQALYYPISDGVYPYMVEKKNINLIKKILCIFMPIVTIGCLICFFGSDKIVLIISGPKYSAVSNIFRMMIPVLFFSFPGILLGWPTLGSIDKNYQTTVTTTIAAIVQVIFLLLLTLTNNFTLINIAIGRCLSEFVLFLTRLIYVIIYRNEFNQVSRRVN